MNTPTCQFSIPVPFLKALGLFASKDGVRPILNGIGVEAKPGEVLLVATDGRRMLIVNTTDDIHELDCPADGINFVIPRELLEALPSPASKARKRLAITTDGETVTISGTRDVSMPVPQGNYPKWREVVPKTEAQPMSSLNLHAGFLNDFPRAFQLMFNDCTATITQHGDASAAFMVRPATHRGINAVGVLMPVRLSEQPKLPAWLTNGANGSAQP